MIEKKLIVSLGDSGQAPEWIRLIPSGEVLLADGRPPFILDDLAVELVLAGFARRGNDLVVDYEHQTITGSEAPAAGWIKELKAALDGLWARVEWTDRAREYIEAKEYRYFSPVVELEPESRRVLDLLHAGLTNFPAIRNLPPLTAKGQEGLESRTNEEAVMVGKMKELLGLPGDADEATVLAALKDRQQQGAGLVAELGTVLGLAEANAAQVKGAILALKAGQDKLTAIETELTALRQERRQEKAAGAVEAAVQAGKVTPAQREWALKYAQADMEGFENYVATAPRVVPVTEPAEPVKPAGQAGVTADELAMCRAIGLSPEQFKATRQAELRAVEEVA